MSARESLRAVRSGKARGIAVTCEVTPHHFILTDEELEYDTNLKMNPPLRAPADRDAMLDGLVDGTIDAIATDHAPHHADEKATEFDRAPFGIIGLETAVSLSLDRLVHRDVVSLWRLVELFSRNPARILGVPGGTLAAGTPADITVLAPDVSTEVAATRFRSKARNTPFDGWRLRGRGRGDHRRWARCLHERGGGRRRHADRTGVVTRRPTAEALSALDVLYQQFDRRRDITDPIQRVRRYTDPADQEVVGFCAAALAYGRVASVLQSIDALLSVMGPSPARFVRRFDPSRHAATIGAVSHRWTRGDDLLALLWVLRRMVESHGSIQGFFLEDYRAEADDVGDALESFCARALATDLDLIYGRRPRRGVAYFFPRPSKRSGCKRLNLYLRWMVRRDRIDLGAWDRVDPAKLIVPLDTHVIRVGQCLRLTRYRSPGWAMAREITASLRRVDPTDPVKYDFALCHLGMLDQCGFTEPQADSRCPLRGLCRPARRRPRRSRRPSGLR